MKTTKSATLLLSLLLLLPSFAGCSESGTNPDETLPDASVSGTGTVEEAALNDTENAVFTAAVPDGTNYDGYEFTIMVYDNSNHVWRDSDFSQTEFTGDVLNDAAYERKVKVEDALNFKLVPVPTGTFPNYTPMYNSVQSDDGAYDCGMIAIPETFDLAEKNMVYDYNTIAEFDINAPWWDQNCVNQLSIAHKNFALTGDISNLYLKSSRVLYFNKQIAADYQIPNPYEMLNERTWTLDALTQLCRMVSADLNGDGIRDKNDLYGIVYSDGTAPIIYVASGVRFATKDQDDLPVLSFFTEHTAEVCEKYGELLFDKQCAGNCGVTGWDYEQMFLNNQSLFSCMELHHVEPLREMDNDFGILPMPLFDEAQEDYCVTTNNVVAPALVVPVTNENTTRTAYILDMLGAESKNIFTPAYYEKYLKGKSARDEESRISLDIIIHSMMYDIGACYDWSGISSIPRDLLLSESTNIASLFKTNQRSAQKAMEKTIKLFMEDGQ